MADSDINVEICNLALSHVGGYHIESITDPTEEARECKRLYLPAKDAALEAFDWEFARKEKALALLTGTGVTRSGWDFSYEWPSDCIAPRKIYNPSNKFKKIEMEEGVNDELTKRVILVNVQDASLVYTARVTTSNVFTSMFKEAFAYKLASDLAMPLRSDRELKGDLFNEFRIKIGGAQESSANQSEKDYTSQTSSFEDSR